MPNTSKKIKRVVQQNVHGCAVACVAMLAGVSYKRAKATVHKLKGVPTGKRRDYAYYLGLHLMMTDEEVAQCLRMLGKRVKLAPDLTAAEKKHPFCVGFNWRSADASHMVVWCPERQGYIDPGQYDCFTETSKKLAHSASLYERNFELSWQNFHVVVVLGDKRQAKQPLKKARKKARVSR